MAKNYWIEVYETLDEIIYQYDSISDLLAANPDIVLTGGEPEDDWVSVEYEGAEFSIGVFGLCLELDSNFTITNEWRAPEELNIHQLRRMEYE